MTEPHVTTVLERAVDALSPRDPDPVGAVMRRVRARRRRMIARAGAVVVAVAVLSAGSLALGGGGDDTKRTVPATTGEERVVVPWEGRTASLDGVTVPVPDGWRVVHQAAVGDADSVMHCRGRAEDRVVYLVEDGEWGPCWHTDAQFVTVFRPESVWPEGRPPLRLQRDPSGQPVWTYVVAPKREPGREKGVLKLVFSGVQVNTDEFPVGGSEDYFAGVTVRPTRPRGPIALPDTSTRAGSVDYTDDDFDALDPVRVTDEQASSVMPAGAASLTCLPDVGHLSIVTFYQGGDRYGPGPGQMDTVTFDRSGRCDLAFDDQGGLSHVDGPALHDLVSGVRH